MARAKAANVMNLAFRDHVRGLSRENRAVVPAGRSFWSLLYDFRCEEETEATLVMLTKSSEGWPLEGWVVAWEIIVT